MLVFRCFSIAMRLTTLRPTCPWATQMAARALISLDGGWEKMTTALV